MGNQEQRDWHSEILRILESQIPVVIQDPLKCNKGHLKENNTNADGTCKKCVNLRYKRKALGSGSIW